MKRSCSNCTPSQFEGYCGQMAVCDDFQPRIPYAELLPTKDQIRDEAKFNGRQQAKKSRKTSKAEPRRKSSSKRTGVKQFKSEASRKKQEAYLREDKRLKETYEHLEPLHAFPRDECSKKRVIEEVRGWCNDHGIPYHEGFENESEEKLICRFICNEKNAGERKTGNYKPDPVKVIRCFQSESSDPIA